MKLSDAAEHICSGLLKLTREGVPGDFLVVSAGEIYVQFSGSPGNPQVVCESISNKYLPTKLKAPAAVIKKLKGFGFVLSGGEIENFSQTFDLTTEKQARELAKLAVRVLNEVYGVAKKAEVVIEPSLE